MQAQETKITYKPFLGGLWGGGGGGKMVILETLATQSTSYTYTRLLLLLKSCC